MHAITYQFKRAHLCAVAMGRRLFRGTPGKELDEDFDGVPHMTPARFDILYLIHRETRGGHPSTLGCGQSLIRRELGLATATISKSIKRLGELGIVEWEFHGRCKFIRLTPDGRRLFRRALHLVFSGRKIADHVRAFVTPSVPSRPKRGLASRLASRLDDLWFELMNLSQHFGDRSEPVHALRWDGDH